MEQRAINTTNVGDIEQLIDEVNKGNMPVLLTNTRGKNAILISEDYLRDMEETYYLQSIPSMAESIIEGLNTPIEDCIPEDKFEW